jgi:ABC-type transport system involved in multi-copper enzyme maturation permease subunit
VLSFPLIARELRVQSRQRATYTARIAWGLGAVGLLLFFSLSFPAQAANGGIFLSTVHVCLALMLFVLAPVGASDSISREKREGTLALLLLTQLTPAQIVLGKLAAHGIRLFYLALMMLPFLVIPVLLGGVGLQDFFLTSISLFTIAAAGIAAGLLASAIFLSFGAALAWAVILCALLILLITGTVSNAALELFPNTLQNDLPAAVRIFLVGPALLLLPLSARDFAGMFIASAWLFPFLQAGLLILSILFLLFAIFFAAHRVAQRREFVGETKRQAAFREQFLTPIVWRNRYRKVMNRKLDANPFIWLEYRTAWARSARWAMILLVIIAETAFLIMMPDSDEFISLHFMMLCVLVSFLTLKSSSSFQREKESGAFELLLVSPLTEKALWVGRLRAVASYYGLTILVLAALGIYGFNWVQKSFSFEAYYLSRFVNFLSICASVISVPICGLYFALRFRTFLPALLWTVGVAVLGPLCLWAAFNGMTWYTAARAQWSLSLVLHQFLRDTWWPALLAVAAYHLFISCHCSSATLRLLRERKFAAGS